MAGPTTFTPQKSFLSIAPETTPGTPVAPTNTIPIRKGDFDDVEKWLDDPSLRGSMTALNGRYQGVEWGTFDFEGPAFMDTFPFLLQNMLGDRTTTGAADPYTHAFAVNNSVTGQPKTHTLTYSTGITATTGARTWAGACLSDLSITYDAESKLVEYKAKGQSWASQPAGTTPTAGTNASPPFASWRTIMGVGGPAAGGTLIASAATFDLELKRKLDAIFTFTNAQTPFVIQRGVVSASGKASFITTDESQLLAMRANTQQQVQLVLLNGITGAGQRGLTINANLVSFKTVKLNEGKTAQMWDVTFDGIANSSDAGATGGISPCKITVINGLAGTVY